MKLHLPALMITPFLLPFILLWALMSPGHGQEHGKGDRLERALATHVGAESATYSGVSAIGVDSGHSAAEMVDESQDPDGRTGGLEFNERAVELDLRRGIPTGTFFFSNDGPGPVQVKQFQVSCGCVSSWMKVYAADRAVSPAWQGAPSVGLEIPSGSWGSLEVYVDPESATPGRSYFVTIVRQDDHAEILHISDPRPLAGQAASATSRGHEGTQPQLGSQGQAPIDDYEVKHGTRAGSAADFFGRSAQLVQESAIEELAARTPRSATFLHPDGSRSVLVAAGPVFFQPRGRTGGLERIDMAPQLGPSGLWEVTSSPIRFQFDDSRGGETVGFEAGLARGCVTFLGAEGGRDRILGPERKGRFGLAGSQRMEFVNEGDDQTWMSIYDLLNGECEHSFVLYRPPALDAGGVLRFVWSLTAARGSGVVPTGGPSWNGEYQGVRIFSLNDGRHVDIGQFKVFDHAGAVLADGGSGIRVSSVDSGDSWDMVLEVPAEWLLDRAREYPVTIDPTISESASCGRYIQTSTSGTSCLTDSSLVADCHSGNASTLAMDANGGVIRQAIFVWNLPLTLTDTVTGVTLTLRSSANGGHENGSFYLREYLQTASCCPPTSYGSCGSGCSDTIGTYSHSLLCQTHTWTDGALISRVQDRVSNHSGEFGVLLRPITSSLEVGFSKDYAKQTLEVTYISCSYSCSINTSSIGHGNVCVGSSDPQSFTVTNTSTSTCSSVSYSVSESCPEWSVTPNSFTLSPGQSRTVTATFAPTSTGGKTCSILVSGNGCSRTIAATGTGDPCCSCTVSTSTLDHGSVCPGTGDSETFVVTNTGGASCGSVTYSVTENCPDWGVSPSSFALAPGQSQTVTATFTPSSTGSQNCSILVSGNGCSQVVNASGIGDSGVCGGSTNSIILSGPAIIVTAVPVAYSWSNAPPGATWFFLWSFSNAGTSYSGHSFDLGPTVHIQSQGLVDPYGQGGITVVAPSRAGATDRLVYFEVASLTGTGQIDDSNMLTVQIL